MQPNFVALDLALLPVRRAKCLLLPLKRSCLSNDQDGENVPISEVIHRHVAISLPNDHCEMIPYAKVDVSNDRN